jgi:endo-1,3-1,4-beta-glycanase ExoK
VQFTLHWIDPRGQKRQIDKTVKLDFDAGEAFHTWEIEWVSDRVAFYVDGKELHRFSDPEALAELRNPQEVKANLWVSPSVPWVGVFDEKSLPLESLYDSLAVYRMDD